MTDFGLYLVMTNPRVGYAKCAEAAVKAGVKIIQLRMKHATKDEIIRQAQLVRKVTAGTDTLFIVNDDPQIAVDAGADGVHVGQDDMPPSRIRDAFPELKIIGLSTHNPAQTAASADEPIDYIGVGPVYTTPTKDIPDPTLGIGTMQKMLKLAAHPAVAIGGINAERLRAVVEGGAQNVAVVRAVCQSDNPYKELVELIDEINRAKARRPSP